MSDLGTEKEMYKHRVIYEMCGDEVFFVIPQSEHYSERRLVMTKDLFIACYEHWIKKAERDRTLTTEKTGEWFIDNKKAEITCNMCGESFNSALLPRLVYCPNCGARMVVE